MAEAKRNEALGKPADVIDILCISEFLLKICSVVFVGESGKFLVTAY